MRANGAGHISVIIPTLNGAAWIGRLLAALREQDCQPDQVLVVDSGSGDQTVALARAEGAEVLSVAPETFDHGATRSMAGRQAVGDIIVYLTQDAIPADPAALANLVTVFADDRVAAAYGRQLPHGDATPFAEHLRAFNYPATPVIRCWDDREKYGFRTAFISNSFAAYRRDRLAAVGYFSEGMLFGEDTFTLAKLLRKGYCVAYAADARVYHSHNYSLATEFCRYFDIGVVHDQQREFMASFGSPGGEGLRYVKSELAYLARAGKYHLVPVSMVRSAAKFIAYHLGRRYDLLPKSLARQISLNRKWWQAQGDREQ